MPALGPEKGGVTIWDDEFRFAVWCWCGAGSLCLFEGALTEKFALAGGAKTRNGRVCFQCAADLARRESLPDQYGQYWAKPWTEEAYRGWIPWLPNFPRTLAVLDPTGRTALAAPWLRPHRPQPAAPAQAPGLTAQAPLPAASNVPPWEEGVQPAPAARRTWPSSVPPWEERAQPAELGTRSSSSALPWEQCTQPAAPAAPPVPRPVCTATPPWPDALAEPAALSATVTPEQRLQELELQVSELRMRLLLLEDFIGIGR
jgi:hypothetical protein